MIRGNRGIEMKPYGRRQSIRFNMHGSHCSICYPDDVTKARARQEGKRESEDGE